MLKVTRQTYTNFIAFRVISVTWELIGTRISKALSS